jgi:DNA-binding MarR family transcriptional regulator
MAPAPERQLVNQWRDLATCYNKTASALDRELQEQHGMGLSEFEALDRLVESHEDKVRMHELASDMYLSQSALSRTVARLERSGLVERTICFDDRRSVFVRLTDAGGVRHAQARDTHRHVLADYLDR